MAPRGPPARAGTRPAPATARDGTRNEPEETALFDRALILMAAEKGGLDSEEHRGALDRMLRLSREEGMDRVMDELSLDAFVSPTNSPAWKTDVVLGDSFTLSSSSPSARAGYPIITLPMGEVDGLPVGVSLFGRAWSEPVLLEIAYAFEQAGRYRIVPGLRRWKAPLHPSRAAPMRSSGRSGPLAGQSLFTRTR